MIRKALITGASSGIGEALARLFAEKGIDLLLTGRDTDMLRHIQEQLGGDVHVEIATVDLLERSERKKFIHAFREFQPDLVVNNAGFGLYGEASSINTEDQLKIVEVNISALTETTIEAVKMFREKNLPGTVMNISSVAGLHPFPCFAVYAASKAYVTLFSESVDAENKEQGIRVLAACPGQVSTQFADRASHGSYTTKGFGVMDVSFAAEEIWKQIIKKKPVRIFDWRYRFGAFLVRCLTPKKLLYKILKRSIHDRIR